MTFSKKLYRFDSLAAEAWGRVIKIASMQFLSRKFSYENLQTYCKNSWRAVHGAICY